MNDRLNVTNRVVEQGHYRKSNLIQKKKKLIECSKNLTKLEYNEIFTIIKKDKCEFSQNINGVFINLTNIEESTIDKIFDFIQFIKQKKKELYEKEDLIEDFKRNIKDESIEEKYENKRDEQVEDCDTLSIEEETDELDQYLCFSSDDEKC